MESDLVFIGSLWRNKSKSGNDYISGNFGMAKILIFRNNKAEKDSDPAYYMYIAPKPKKDDETSPATADEGPF